MGRGWMLSPVGSCIGDINGDRRVDGRDLMVIRSNLGNVNQAHWVMDLDDNGKVDGVDMQIVINNMGCYEW